ncbi:MAG TPA: NUDIX domain-containing protein [Anaerolineales bacterium]|nr:NUDIX domain-containing protein [Anaerolineales bacterium]
MIEGPIRFCPRCGSTLIAQLHSGKLRPSCPKCEWVYFPDPKVAVAVLLKQNGQVLLVQRKYDPQKGYWTLPSGFVDAGEDPRQAARRECQEETGLVIRDIRLLDVLFSQEHPRGASILIIYRAEFDKGELTSGDDARQAAFFDFDHLPPLAFASTHLILDQYFKS